MPYAFATVDWPGPRAMGSGYRGGTEGLLGLSGVTDRIYGTASQGFRAVLTAPEMQ